MSIDLYYSIQSVLSLLLNNSIGLNNSELYYRE